MTTGREAWQVEGGTSTTSAGAPTEATPAGVTPPSGTPSSGTPASGTPASGTPASGPRLIRVPAGINGDVVVLRGTRVLAGALDGAGIAAHRNRWRSPISRSAAELIELARSGQVSGRGGAAFPLARKLSTVSTAGRDPVVVINAAEGEPGSAKDSAMLLTVPHLVLDGAAVAADALKATEIHLVVPHERPAVVAAAERAAAEYDHRLPVQITTTSAGFVAGQASAVIELLSGRENLPVTTWTPPAVSGLRGRPTLLSNAETFAQLAVLNAIGPQAFSRVGTADQPGTTLLSVAGDGPHGVVVEVPYGVALADVLRHIGHEVNAPVMLGGYHGAWLHPDAVATVLLARADLAAHGARLGAGVILPVPREACPVDLTAQVVSYLASQSARRCGPCRNGLPALSQALNELSVARAGQRVFDRIAELAGLLPGRGSCAHPDATIELVRSLLRVFAAEVGQHVIADCTYRLAGVPAPFLEDLG